MVSIRKKAMLVCGGSLENEANGRGKKSRKKLRYNRIRPGTLGNSQIIDKNT